jgi:hypothetical protein
MGMLEWKMRKWMLSAGIVLLGFALASAATATVNVNLTALTPMVAPGDTITLNVLVTADDWEVDPTAFGAVIYPSAAVAPDTQQQFALPGNWSLGATNCDGTRCIAFSQVSDDGPVPIFATDYLIATLTFDVLPTSPAGVFSFNWQTTPYGQRLDFFGLTNAPGVSVTVVPEPATALLLGVGLLGLGVRRRRLA